MLNWLKFFPVVWKGVKNPTDVQGPKIPTHPNNAWHFNDSVLHFKAPKPNSVYNLTGKITPTCDFSPGAKNILSYQWETSHSSNSEKPLSNWDYYRFYESGWHFVSPWFSGLQASLYATSLLMKAKPHSRFFNMNQFHPRTFEAAIVDHMDNNFGYVKNGRNPHYRGPLNWCVIPISESVRAVACDVHQIGNGSKSDPALYKLVFFPVAPDALVILTFDFCGTRILHDKIRVPPQLQLYNSIISSFHLDVGPETQAEWDKVKATCPDMSLTESFGELPWPLTMEKKPKNKKEVDITPQSVPQKLEQGQ